MPSLGKIEEFDPASTNINRYLERLEQYFIANSVPADTGERFKRRATLISVIGSKAYDVLSDLCSPESPSEKTYDNLATILKDHFASKRLLIAERYRFHNCIQLEGEGVSTFAAKLKHLASTCNFGTHLSQALRDRLVCGLRNKEIQKKLLTEEHNFDEALKKALGAEAAEKDVAAFSQKDVSHATPVNKLDSDGRPPYRPRRPRRPSGKGRGKMPLNQNQNHSTSACLSCGKTGHPRSQCKYRNYTCHTCGQSGHITDACKSKSQKIHTVEEPEASQLDPPSDSFSLSVFSIDAENKGIEVPVELNGIHLLMELDTGAGVSIISQETYNRHFKETSLQPCDNRLHTYTGTHFKSLVSS